MKSIFSTIFLDKVKAAVDKRRCKVALNGDDEHHFELYKKLCINYWCSKYGDNALETSQQSKTIAEYATSDQTPTPSEPCEYTYILGALAKIHSGTQEGSKQTRGDSTYTAGY